MTTYYKVVMPDGAPTHGGNGLWPLPTEDAAGEWREIDGEIVPCQNGLHVTTLDNLHVWLTQGAVVYRAEVDGPAVDAGNKYVARRVRLLPRPLPADVASQALDRVSAAGMPIQRDYRRPTYLESVDLPKEHVLYARAQAARAAADKRIATAQRKAARARAKAIRQAAAFWSAAP
jgi:hypothetical protein